MMTLIRGDTFSHIAEYRDDCNRLIDLTDNIIIGSVEAPDQSWSENLIITVFDQTINKGKFVIAASDTSLWRVGEMVLRVSRMVDGAKSSTVTKFKVIEG